MLRDVVDARLLERARELHGHVCPFLVLGLRASEVALARLGARGRIAAVVEAINCMVDGVQVATGCTLGNGSLIYLDTGKNAVTVFERETGRGVRVYIDAERLREKYFPPEALALREKVFKGEANEEEMARFRRMWEETALKLAELPEEEFKIEEVRVRIDEAGRETWPAQVRCEKCGELVQASKAVYIDGKALCRACAGQLVEALTRRGVAKIEAPHKL